MTLCIIGHDFAYEMECLVRLFFPGVSLTLTTEQGDHTGDVLVTQCVAHADQHWRLFVSVCLEGITDEAEASLPAEISENRREKALARLLYGILAKRCGKQPPWGILTGIRPVRLYRSIAQHTADARMFMQQEYLLNDEKMRLVTEIAAIQERLIAQKKPNGFSLYISIPFCPSRCLYCSFISHDIKGAAKLVPDYVRLLCEEIRLTGEIARRQGLCLQTVYIGGGTPTTLTAEQLQEIMQVVQESFDCSQLLEYTVEAGRPDTVTPQKLAVLRQMGADRISINPQTMDDRVLQMIGRDHTALQIQTAFRWAREAGFANINMDLIAGLPGDTQATFRDTLHSVLALEPENITVHTLTVKRSSRLREHGEQFAEPSLDVAALLQYSSQALFPAGYRPYYLYRQKGTVQNLENVGWARTGTEGFYNIYIMEELQTILAVGAGASTKICRADGSLQRIYNYKFPYEYIAQFEEIKKRKQQAEQLIAGT